jgi:hypothetical protein
MYIKNLQEPGMPLLEFVQFWTKPTNAGRSLTAFRIAISELSSGLVLISTMAQ